MKNRFNIYISSLSIKALQSLALSLGYIQDRGPAKGQGSISAMVEALAQGQLEIKRKDTVE